MHRPGQVQCIRSSIRIGGNWELCVDGQLEKTGLSVKVIEEADYSMCFKFSLATELEILTGNKKVCVITSWKISVKINLSEVAWKTCISFTSVFLSIFHIIYMYNFLHWEKNVSNKTFFVVLIKYFVVPTKHFVSVTKFDWYSKMFCWHNKRILLAKY